MTEPESWHCKEHHKFITSIITNKLIAAAKSRSHYTWQPHHVHKAKYMYMKHEHNKNDDKTLRIF